MYLWTLTLFEMKSFVDSTNKKVFQWGDWLLKYISFGGHQSQTIKHIKVLYDMCKCMLIIFWEKGAWNFTKNISNFCRFLLSFFAGRVFIVIKYLTTANQLSTEQQKFLSYDIQIFQSTLRIKCLTIKLFRILNLWSEKSFSFFSFGSI